MKIRLFPAVIWCTILVLNIVSADIVRAGTFFDPEPIPTVLFEVTSPETGHKSYLFGTHHAFGKTFFDSLSIAREKLLNSEVLIKENIDIPGHMLEDIVNSRSKVTAWPKYLSKVDHQYAEVIFSKSNVDLNRITPTELSVFLNRYYSTKVCEAKEATDPPLSLDDYIATVAAGRQITLIGLETTEEQLEIIRKDVEGMPRKVHKKRLARLIEQIRSANASHCSAVKKYAGMTYDYQFEQACQNVIVLTERNNKWMPGITDHLKTSRCFIAVGLSHLMFECGLISQLRQLGYTVTPVAPK